MPVAASDVVDEFRAALNDAAAVFGIARSALPITQRELLKFADQTNMKEPDLVHLSIAPDSTKKGPNDAFAAWPLAQLPKALSPNGAIAMQIGHQWVVHVYHLWEGHYREAIALARGLNSMNELQNPHFGDLAKIRHDILKHRGVASRKNAAKCVHLKWFSEGADILVQDWMVYEFMSAFGVVFPASGDAPKPLYPFHGLIDSPIKFEATIGDRSELAGEVRSLSGKPVDVEALRAIFVGAQFELSGPGGQGTATGVDVQLSSPTNDAVLVVVRAPLHFVRKVQAGTATARLALGSEIPQKKTRKAVPALWHHGNVVRAEAIAPEGKYYDLATYLRQVNDWLPLTSEIGDLFEGRLISAAYGVDRRALHLYLEIDPELAELVRRNQRTLRIPLDLGQP